MEVVVNGVFIYLLFFN